MWKGFTTKVFTVPAMKEPAEIEPSTSNDSASGSPLLRDFLIGEWVVPNGGLPVARGREAAKSAESIEPRVGFR